MEKDIIYVVQLSNGKYYVDHGEADDIKDANIYHFEWAIRKDIFLKGYLTHNKLNYKVLKFKRIVNIDYILIQ